MIRKGAAVSFFRCFMIELFSVQILSECPDDEVISFDKSNIRLISLFLNALSVLGFSFNYGKYFLRLLVTDFSDVEAKKIMAVGLQVLMVLKILLPNLSSYGHDVFS